MAQTCCLLTAGHHVCLTFSAQIASAAFRIPLFSMIHIRRLHLCLNRPIRSNKSSLFRSPGKNVKKINFFLKNERWILQFQVLSGTVNETRGTRRLLLPSSLSENKFFLYLRTLQGKKWIPLLALPQNFLEFTQLSVS